MRLTLLLCLFLLSPLTTAQEWPTKPVRLILPFAAGGAVDVVTRITMNRVSEQTGQQFLVDNRPGASGNLGTEAAAKSAPDGYTFLVGSPGTIAINPHFYPTLPYDAHKDFVPVVHFASFPQVLGVYNEVPAQTLADLIALAKREPGKLNYGSGGNGSTGHLITEAFLRQAGIKITHVPFRGGGPAVQGLAGGQVHLVIDGLPSFASQLQSGRIRVLAVTSKDRWPEMPNVPAIGETAVPGFDLSSWALIAAPVKTPENVLRRFAAETTKALAREDVQARLRQVGALPAGGTPEQALRFHRAEYEKWGNVVRTTGAKPD
ncbi:MAG TPA: tripartite tricarboxylate transporter substrate binding protein [Burkholderiales bacterium]|nr:tripartite tricarboxylate transporter substrate binding protein [Burkholderiales bacterium]